MFDRQAEPAVRFGTTTPARSLTHSREPILQTNVGVSTKTIRIVFEVTQGRATTAPIFRLVHRFRVGVDFQNFSRVTTRTVNGLLIIRERRARGPPGK